VGKSSFAEQQSCEIRKLADNQLQKILSYIFCHKRELILIWNKLAALTWKHLWWHRSTYLWPCNRNRQNLYLIHYTTVWTQL